MTEHIIVADEESTRTITMRRPEKKNTLTQEMYLAMSDAIDSAQSDPAIRCLIVTGRSGVFTAGNDIADFLQAATAKDDVVRPRNAVIFLQSLVNNRKPIIAAVDGIAIGIGTTIAIMSSPARPRRFRRPLFSMALFRRALPACCCHGWLGTSVRSPCW